MPDDTKNAPARNLRKSLLSPSEIEAPDSHDDSCNYVEGNYHPFLLSSPFQDIWAGCGPAARLSN